MGKIPKVVMIRLRDTRYDARILRIAQSLARNGYQIHILHLPARNGKGIINIPRVRVDEISLTLRNLPHGKMGLAMKYLEFALRAFFAAFQSRADIYSAGTTDALLIAYAVGRIRKAKVLYEAQELFPDIDGIPFRRFWRWIEHLLLPRLDGITAANIERAQVMASEYRLRKIPIVISNCPPSFDPSVLQKVSWPIPKALDGERLIKIVLYQGSISEDRGLIPLIRALYYLDERVFLALVGPVEAKFGRRVSAEAKEIGVQHRILWLGPVPRRELDRYTISADAGIMFYESTCRNNYLCAPNKLYEYLMAGLPIVASDLPEIRRVIEETKAGVIVDSSDSKSIASGLGRILGHPGEWKALCEDTRALAKQKYCWESQEDKIITVYRRALEREHQPKEVRICHKDETDIRIRKT